MSKPDPITNSTFPSTAHSRYAEDEKGKVPALFEANSVVWDNEESLSREDGRTWIEWLFDIWPPVKLAEFEPYNERSTPFTTTLVRNVNWENLEEKLKEMEGANISSSDKEMALILLDLVQQSKPLDKDIKHTRLARRPKG